MTISPGEFSQRPLGEQRRRKWAKKRSMEEEQDAGVAQLWEVFDACDTERTGRLDARGLQLLCHRLQLANRAPALIHHLFGRRGAGGRRRETRRHGEF
ncbi:hypothetical protein MTO96_007245 [Rhipicephalus appendiculatus]